MYGVNIVLEWHTHLSHISIYIYIAGIWTVTPYTPEKYIISILRLQCASSDNVTVNSESVRNISYEKHTYSVMQLVWNTFHEATTYEPHVQTSFKQITTVARHKYGRVED